MTLTCTQIGKGSGFGRCSYKQAFLSGRSELEWKDFLPTGEQLVAV